MVINPTALRLYSWSLKKISNAELKKCRKYNITSSFASSIFIPLSSFLSNNMSRLFLSNTVDYSQSKGKIVLQTSLGNDIDNYQIEELSQYEINSFADYSQARWVGCTFKGQPTPKYNCHGFTFASRRTNIDKTSELRKILKDDSYIPINDGRIMVGDVVLYVDNSGSGDIKHTGMVVRSDLNDAFPLILILSKWGKYKEVIHPVHNCGYNNYVLEYWRNNHGYVISK